MDELSGTREVYVGTHCPQCHRPNEHSFTTDKPAILPELRCECGAVYKLEDDPDHEKIVTGPHLTWFGSDLKRSD
jgi:hypothetical protein